MKEQRVCWMACVAAVLAGVGQVWADAVTWDGGPDGTGTNWNEAVNWNGDVKPGVGDAAVFTDAGLTSGKIISLDTDQTVFKVVIQTVTAFTIGSDDDRTNSTPRVLTLTEVERQDVAGVEGLHVFAAPVAIAPDVSSNSTWTVAGSSVLRMNARLSAASTPVTLIKTGTGTLNMNYTSPTFAGPWRIVEGAITASGSGTSPNSMKGNVTIGGSTNAASLTQSNKNALFNNIAMTVLTNGTFSAADIDNGRVDSIRVEEGGVATIGSYFYSVKAYLKGGRINGGRFFNGGYGQTITSYASDREALFNCEFGLSTYYDFEISTADGGAPVDLSVTKTITSNSSSKAVKKSGAGVCQLMGASTFSYSGLNLSAGTLLADNTSGSAFGNTPVAVAAGATLGGVGLVGGVAAYINANVTGAGSVTGSTTNRATVAPGSIDPVTGAHVIGTLTVGNLAVQTNNVTFGAYSTLKVNIDATGACDRLVVNGTLSLATASDTLDLNVADANALKSGTYTLATFQQLAAPGQVFDAVVGLPSRGNLVYTATSIDYVINPTGTVISVK